jgi:hypothetical protein
MPDVLELDKTGRAKCRGCGKLLQKGELRFGESVPNPFAEGESHRLFHLTCAAFMRPEKLLPVLDAYEAELPDRDEVRSTTETSLAHRRLPRLLRAERASSSRARCRSCKEPIDKGSFRLALQLFEEDMRPVPIGFIHPSCAEAYFGTSSATHAASVMDRIAYLSPELSDDDRAELASALSRPGPGLAKAGTNDDSGSTAQSG